MDTFDSLVKEVRACRLCEANLPLGPRPVVQVDPAARILIAGQAPGIKVHQTGIPFNDPSGERLRSWMGIDRKIFYDPKLIAVVPMGFCYPGTGTGGDLPPRPECHATWRATLLKQLPNIELTLVLGKYAQAYHLLGTTASVTELVRSWRNYWPDLLPLPHPSPRNNRWLKNNPWFEEAVIPALQQRVKALLAAD